MSVHAGTAVEAITHDGVTPQVQGANGLDQADLVLIVVGARPQTSLGAETGIGTGIKDAFKVSRRMETSQPGIYTAGECVETWHRVTQNRTYNPLGTRSHKQGRIAGKNAVGSDRE